MICFWRITVFTALSGLSWYIELTYYELMGCGVRRSFFFFFSGIFLTLKKDEHLQVEQICIQMLPVIMNIGKELVISYVQNNKKQ